MSRRPTHNLTGSHLSDRVSQYGRRSFIRSIQRGTIAIAASQGTGTATINAVDIGNAHIRWCGEFADAAIVNNEDYHARVELTNSTTVTAYRIAATDINPTVSWEVVEYWPGVIKSLQAGTISMATTTFSATATVTAVDTTKAQLHYLGVQATAVNTTNAAAWPTQLVLTNGTTITATRFNPGASNFDSVTVGYVLVEHY